MSWGEERAQVCSVCCTARFTFAEGPTAPNRVGVYRIRPRIVRHNRTSAARKTVHHTGQSLKTPYSKLIKNTLPGSGQRVCESLKSRVYNRANR